MVDNRLISKNSSVSYFFDGNTHIKSEIDALLNQITLEHGQILQEEDLYKHTNFYTKSISYAEDFDINSMDESVWFRDVLGVKQDKQSDVKKPLNKPIRFSSKYEKSNDADYNSTNQSTTENSPCNQLIQKNKKNASTINKQSHNLFSNIFSKLKRHNSDFMETETIWEYIWSCICSLTDENSIRGKQAHLTIWELLEHFDFCNDLLFIIKIYSIMHMKENINNANFYHLGSLAILCLICIWIISITAYGCRCHLFYHRINNQNHGIFYPFLVFHKIRQLGDYSVETIYMFQRLSWTYQLVLRILEDIPQLIISTIFLINFGQNLYTYFMIAYSCTLMIITSIRMGLSYPLFNTLSIIFSRTPPIDSPNIDEAAPITRKFFLFLAFVFGLWTITNALCMSLSSNIAFIFFLFLAIVCFTLMLICLFYWTYTNHQMKYDYLAENQLLDDNDLCIELASTRKN